MRRGCVFLAAACAAYFLETAFADRLLTSSTNVTNATLWLCVRIAATATMVGLLVAGLILILRARGSTSPMRARVLGCALLAAAGAVYLLDMALADQLLAICNNFTLWQAVRTAATATMAGLLVAGVALLLRARGRVSPWRRWTGNACVLAALLLALAAVTSSAFWIWGRDATGSGLGAFGVETILLEFVDAALLLLLVAGALYMHRCARERQLSTLATATLGVFGAAAVPPALDTLFACGNFLSLLGVHGAEALALPRIYLAAMLWRFARLEVLSALTGCALMVYWIYVAVIAWQHEWATSTRGE
jgi:hypothetical protein